MYGRGVDDDKGTLPLGLTAVRKYIQREHGDLPVNIIFMMEGEKSLLRQNWINIWSGIANAYAERICWSGEQGSRNNLGQLETSGGNKGELLPLDTTVKSAAVDIHSSFGGVINSASWNLLQCFIQLAQTRRPNLS